MSDSETAKKLFFEALAFLDTSNFHEAERKLRDAQKLAPDSVPILTNLSVALIGQNKRNEAREWAEKAVAINAGNIEALLVLADCHAHDENAEAALNAYDKVIVLEPGIAAAHNNRGMMLERLGRHAEALESYDKALALESNLVDAHINRGNALHNLQRHDEALVAYEMALALVPDLAEAWLGRGNVLHELKRYDEALAAYDQVLARNRDLPHAWLGRGNVFGKLKRYDDAFDAYDNALTRKPDFVEAWLGRGNALCDVRRHDDALAAYDKVLTLSPEFAAAWFGRGNVYHDLKRFDAALAAYDKAVALNPGFANAWLGRGDALRALRRIQEAIEAYRRALKLGGDADSIGYYLAALGAEPSPTAPPARYIASLFDSYADNFDRDLVENLKYRTPVLIADAIKRHASSDPLDILDLGCGTGLVGDHVHALKRSLTGIDLSENMLQKAQQRQIYDRLICSDLAEYLQSQDKTFDVAVAADVFVYVGDLSSIFPAVRRALRDEGMFCFSVEAAPEGDFVLRHTLRYAHSISYLRRLAEQHQFTVQSIESHVIRQDSGADIDGYLAVMHCS